MEIALPDALTAFPAHRGKTVAACQHALGDERVLGMCLGGSFAAGTPDVYSDVDLKLIVADDACDRVVEEIEGFATAAGTVVAAFRGDHLGLTHLLIVLYDDLVHADFLVLPRSGLRAESREVPLAVLWERDDALSTEIVPSEDRDVDAAWFEARVWTWLWYGQTKVLRGEVYEALDMLGYLRDRVLFPLLAATRGVRPSGSRRMEALTGDLAPLFERTVATHERSSALEALRATAELYELLADPILERQGVSPATAARDVVRAALAAGPAWEPGG